MIDHNKFLKSTWQRTKWTKGNKNETTAKCDLLLTNLLMCSHGPSSPALGEVKVWSEKNVWKNKSNRCTLFAIKQKNQGHKCAALYIYAFPTRPSKKHFSKATELAPPLPRYISMLKAQKWCTGVSSQLKRITWWWTLCTWLIEISMSKHLTPIRVHFHKLTWIYFQLLCSVLYSIKLCINEYLIIEIIEVLHVAHTEMS